MTFIANMAHELKTPLTSILGFADIMTIKSDMEETERREYAGVIAAEARRLWRGFQRFAGAGRTVCGHILKKLTESMKTAGNTGTV